MQHLQHIDKVSMNSRKGKHRMKKVLLTILTVIVVAGVLAGAGFVGYRIGTQQSARITTSTNNTPFVHPNVPMHNFGKDLDRGFGHGFGPGGFGMRGGMMGFGFFGPLMFLGRILFWGVILWFIYWLFTKSGWQLTRKTQPIAPAPTVETTPVEPPAPEEKEA
jgi:hypothetical protein